eukprot:CAMPEP_0197828792 /NCGR_PEP_ID=MMETSP1437-20131217/5319_1 /TAXON_ID=49252 ORGANISM="Eucampia antarctica, Strain CCMP1452" /NCGR_SAMPLE_ID=MMETSP1437 /ASSEMBLY_ACC=CAM_ASM_001096 /LENGTH=346 /DNA_ID=CAMNT_0043430169 /DNA_START=86 /DNA_END=1126 /DNA_ORIENTATION=+
MKRKNKRQHRCPEGKSCPYRNEYQHGLEYSHADDNDDDDKSVPGKPSKKAPVVAFTGTGYTMGKQNSISRPAWQEHFQPPSKRKRITPMPQTKKNVEIRSQAEKDSKFPSVAKINKETSSLTKERQNDVIDLCEEDDEEIQVIEENFFTNVQDITENNNAYDENDEVVVDRIVVPPPPPIFESATTYNHDEQNSFLQQQHLQEQLELERAIKESSRDHVIKSQNDDYEQSLHNDREKAQRKRQRIEFLKNRFESTESSLDHQHAATIAFRLPPNGQRVLRKFSNTASAQELYWFIEWLKIDPNSNHEIPDSYTLKPVFGGLEISKEESLKSLGLYPNGVVFVREKS